jgi:hypothetical protein
MDRYLQHVEIAVGKTARDATTVQAALKLLVGSKFRFSRIKLGKEFEGRPAREYIVPIVKL